MGKLKYILQTDDITCGPVAIWNAKYGRPGKDQELALEN